MTVSPYAFAGMKDVARKKVMRKGHKLSHSEHIELMKVAICEFTGMSWQTIIAKKKKGGSRSPSMARHMFCYLLKSRVPTITFKELGKVLNRHHSTVIYSINLMKDLVYVKDPVVLEQLEYLSLNY